MKHALRGIVRRTGEPVWSRLWPRVEAVAERHAAGAARELRGEIAELRTELRGDVAALHEAVDRLSSLFGRMDWTEGETRRIGPHVAALDQRLAGLERQPTELITDDDQQREARSLVTEIRTEHSRVRARLSVVAAYEHRITQLERAVEADWP
jgi:chromosome segregation ATPase